MWGGFQNIPSPLAKNYGECEVHRAMSWFADPPRRCWVCYPEDWVEGEGTYEHDPIIPDPTWAMFDSPAVRQCQVLPDPNSESRCPGKWDGQHTVLGFAICADCYERAKEI